jgi:hypothetical protein
MFMPYKGARTQPWVVDGKLVVDPAMEKYMDMAKTLTDKAYEGAHSSGPKAGSPV